MSWHIFNRRGKLTQVTTFRSARPTQRQIAESLGVDRSTVTLALKKHPSIPAVTRRKIEKTARRLGYYPDPMLAALAAYRARQRPTGHRGTLAWVVNNIRPYNWKNVNMFWEYYLGAKEQAALHGFKLEIFDLQEPGMSHQRLAAIFRARNISGLMLAPQPGPETAIDFPFDDFAAITFGYTLAKPLLNTVAASQFQALSETMRQVYRAGYTRVGLVYSRVSDARADHNYLGGYFSQVFLHQHQPIPPVDPTEESLAAWIKTHQPNALVSAGHGDILTQLDAIHVRVPADLGVACVSVPSPDSELAGVYENAVQIGRVATDLVVASVQQGSRGLPADPHYTHIRGFWVPGRTLPTLPSSKRQRRLG